jgi:fructose-specific phosphotransferase system IIA component
MKISDILNIESIKIGLKVESKRELLNQMVSLAEKSKKLLDREEVLAEVIEREKIMSTGVGKGVALPHAKTNAVLENIAALAILAEPIDFNAIDDSPVNIVFLLLGTENNVGNHLRILSRASRIMNNDEFREKLLKCNTPSEVKSLLENHENQENF